MRSRRWVCCVMRSMEIAYMLCRGAFSWLFTIDDFIMVIPYFWAYMLARENDVSGVERQ